MRYYANPSSEPIRAAMVAGHLGWIATPNQGNRLPHGVDWCADNGCFSANYVGDRRWFDWLTRHADQAGTCRFATAPDIVGDATATLHRSAPWMPRIRTLGYPAALVAQDGLEHLPIPWPTFDVLFLGGSTGWKLGAAARHIAAQAKARGKQVHMGRVNSARRWRYAEHIGCDSADGTLLTYGPDVNLPRLLAWHTAALPGIDR